MRSVGALQPCVVAAWPCSWARARQRSQLLQYLSCMKKMIKPRLPANRAGIAGSTVGGFSLTRCKPVQAAQAFPDTEVDGLGEGEQEERCHHSINERRIREEKVGAPTLNPKPYTSRFRNLASCFGSLAAP